MFVKYELYGSFPSFSYMRMNEMKHDFLLALLALQKSAAQARVELFLVADIHF